MSNVYRSGWSYIGEGIALALVILAVCFGIGGCSVLVNQGWPNQDKPVEQKN